MEKSNQNEQFLQNSAVFLPGNDTTYRAWRRKKLENAATPVTPNIIEVRNLSRPGEEEISSVVTQCEQSNTAIYEVGGGGPPEDEPGHKVLRAALKKFCARLGLHNAEAHRSQGDDGIVALKVDRSGPGGGYIPYTNKALNWHTDGYYNSPDNRIRAMVLHCVRDASEGGVNELLDPEIAYLRLRDANIAYIEALMHERAMIIPENNDKRSAFRAQSVGPVFFLDDVSGALQMRYSARGRNIIWRNDRDCDSARAMLSEILAGDPSILRHKLKPGQGVISNNVLHNRTGFDNSQGNGVSKRLLFRIRYKERVNGKTQ